MNLNKLTVRISLAAFLLACVFSSPDTLAQTANDVVFDPGTGLALTEVMWQSSHPEADVLTGLGGDANGDWFELTNFGSAAINLEGYVFDDNDQLFGNDYAILPALSIQPNESIIILREEDGDRAGGFRDAWGLSSDFRILSECTSTGGDTFSGISSGGDELNFYAPSAVDVDGFPTGELPLLSVAFAPAVQGQSFTWDADHNQVGLSGDTGTGTYTAIFNGDAADPQGAGTDIASPGFVEGLDTASAAGTQPTLTRLFTNEPHFTCAAETFNCDFDGDGQCDLADLDALYAAVGNADVLLDLDASGVVDAGDIIEWLDEASDSDNPAKADPADVYLLGDVNLDGGVDSTDLGNLLNNFGSNSAPGWAGGDLDLSLSVDSTDLGALLNEFGNPQPSAPANVSAVPEPSGLALLTLAALGLVSSRRRK